MSDFVSKFITDLNKRFNEHCEVAAERNRYKRALEKLARLGNGKEYGNSDGNIIAQQALKEG